MNKRIENQFLLLSEKGKNDWWRFVAFLLMLVGLLAINYNFIEEVSLPTFDQTLAILLIEGAAWLLVLLGIIFAIERIHSRGFGTLNYVRPQFFMKEVFEGIAVWGVLAIAGSLINQQDNIKFFLDNRLNTSLLYLIPITVISIGIQTYTEEVIFRGYVLQSLSLRIKNLYALTFAGSSIFGILHLAYGLVDALSVILFGALFCYVVLKRESLAFVSGVHFINNFLFIFVLAGDDNVSVERDFLDFDIVTVAITYTQFILLFLYIRYRSKRKGRAPVLS